MKLDHLTFYEDNGNSCKEKMILKSFKVEVYLLLADSYYASEMYEDAEHACNEAIALDDKCSKAYVLRMQAKTNNENSSLFEF